MPGHRAPHTERHNTRAPGYPPGSDTHRYNLGDANAVAGRDRRS
jgi:hypothetical protein